MSTFLKIVACFLFTWSMTAEGHSFPTKRVDCPCGWVPLVSSCYYFGNVKKTWSEARSYCLNHGGDLVIPINAHEDRTIWNAARQRRHVFPWIGLVRHHDKQFFTVYGLKPTYTHWLAGEPNNPRTESCGHYFIINGKWGWNDTICHLKRHFICEHKRARC